MTSVKFSKLLAVLLSAILMLTLLSTVAFAAEAQSSAAGEETTATPDDATTAAEDADEDDEPADTTAAATTAAATTAASGDKKEETKKVNWDLIISLSIIGIAAIVLVVLYFAMPKFKDAVNKFFRDYKSELGKIVWSSWSDVKKNTLVVIIIVAAFSIMIGVLDLVFRGGIDAIVSLIKK